MKINNPAFFEARKDKQLSAMIVVQRHERNEQNVQILRTYLRLCIHEKEKYTGTTKYVFVETDTNISVTNHSQGTESTKRNITEICFNESVYGPENHIMTFLNDIKKDSEVNFRVVAFNGSNYWNQKNAVSHQLYGSIDKKRYLLSFYVGADNTASPVQ